MSNKGYLYGTSPDEGALTPYIHSFFKPGVEKSVIVALITDRGAEAIHILSCILDGEMLVWDPLLEKYLAFGSLKTAALGT
jgi:DNA ligase-4